MSNRLVLSLFPGIGLLDMAFEEAGFCVVRGPDLIHGGDIRKWNLPYRGLINGVIAGPPCQGFSCANAFRKDPDHRSVRNSNELLQLTCRIIEQVDPVWALIENVPAVPDVSINGEPLQRIAINDFECGGRQLRWRAIQWYHRKGFHLRPVRVNDRAETRRIGRKPEAIRRLQNSAGSRGFRVRLIFPDGQKKPNSEPSATVFRCRSGVFSLRLSFARW